MFGDENGIAAVRIEHVYRLAARVNLRPKMSKAYPTKIEPRIAPG